LAPYSCAIEHDFEDLEDEDYGPDPAAAPREAFAQHTGFFRTRKASSDARFDGFVLPDGPTWSSELADGVIRDFLDRTLDGREVKPNDDTAEYARSNGLMMMFGPDEQERFVPVLERMPADMRIVWEDLLSGGKASEAFGPLTLDEQLDEAQMVAQLDGARKQRRVSLGLVALVLLVVTGGVIAAFAAFQEDPTEAGTIVFEEVAAESEEVVRDGPPPEPSDALTAPLDVAFVVAEGDGEPLERVVEDPTRDLLPVAVDSVWATIMTYAGSPQIVLVGPSERWYDGLCLLVTASTSDLRPIDVAYHEEATGACEDEAFGRELTMWCRGDNVVMFDLDVRPGSFDLPEGGTGTWSNVRVQLRQPVDGYDVASVRGSVEVDQGQTLEVPVFGGDEGAEVDFDIGDASGSCTLQ
jgi:hypothetical protein